MLLALDLGTKTGYTYGHSENLIYGTWDFKPTRFESAGMRYVKMRKQLNQLPGDISFVLYEEVRRHLGTDAAHVYGGLVATLQQWCEENGLNYNSIPVGTIKRFWTGKGNANKADMLAECERRGWVAIDDNAADALALWHLGHSEEYADVVELVA